MEEQIEENTCLQEKAGSDDAKLQELQEQLTVLESALEEKTERWLYLTELDEKIRAQG